MDERYRKMFVGPTGWYSAKQAVAYHFFRQFEDYLLKSMAEK